MPGEGREIGGNLIVGLVFVGVGGEFAGKWVVSLRDYHRRWARPPTEYEGAGAQVQRKTFKEMYPDYKYVSLENPSVRLAAQEDPIGPYQLA